MSNRFPSRERAPARRPSRAVLAAALLGAATAASALDLSKVPPGDWIDLFNGKDLDGWVPKVSGSPAGQDPYHTWYVKDGLLWVDYSGYAGAFNDRFGHLAWEKRKFSYFVFHEESNHWGAQAAGGPDWAYQNNGIMFHSQSMESMALNQGFPVSVEFQILGENNHLNSDHKSGNGTTGNLCGAASNTSMIVNGTRQSPGCVNAKHVAIDSLHWQVGEGLVLADSLVKHMVAGDTGKPVDTVLSYTGIQTQGDGKPLKEGYIAIQGETAPYKFRKIRVLDLVGCTDPKSPSYRSYFVKSDNSRCAAVSLAGEGPWPPGYGLEAREGVLRLTLPPGEAVRVRVLDPAGRPALPERQARGPVAEVSLAGARPGLYLYEVRRGGEAHRGRFAVLGRP